jgi:RecB family exonuclease
LTAHHAAESFRPGILPLDGLIQNSPTLKKLVARGFSPSGMEDLAACPYKFYGAHILRLPIPEDPAPGGQIAANALGKLFHRALELYFVCQNLSTACDQAFEEFQQTYPDLYPLVVKSSKQMVFQYLSSFIESDLEELKASGYAPAYVEKILESPVSELGPELAHVPFRGRLDRIDLKTEGGQWVARVVDYKSGKARTVSGKLETALIQGKFLQLPLYMGMVRAFLAREKGKAGRVESSTLRWLRLEDQGEPEPFLADTFWESPHAKVFRENIKGLIKIAETGHFYIDPSSGEWGHCSRCHFARVCRKEHMPTRARAEEDPVHRANTERLSRTAKEKA